MKVANIIVAHKNPAQLLRLVNQFDGEQFHNFVHVDGRADIKEYQTVAAQKNVTMMPKRLKLVWSGYGFVQVTLDGIELARLQKEKFMYYNLMSGMDLPIRPTNEFYDFLNGQHSGERKEFFDILGLDVWPGAHRFERFHFTNGTFRGRYRLEDLINFFMTKRKFYGGMTPYGRSSWFTASHEFLDYGMKYIYDNPGYLKFLKTTWCPDEFIFNTILMNSPFRERRGEDHLRYIDWSEGKVNPKTFRANDFEAIKSSGQYLARKFDESVDREIIDKVENHISRR